MMIMFYHAGYAFNYIVLRIKRNLFLFRFRNLFEVQHNGVPICSQVIFREFDKNKKIPLYDE